MKPSSRLAATAALILAAPAAIAADPHGLLTLVVGVPLMLAASFVLGLMLIARPGQRRRIVSTALFAPAFLYGLYVALDAITLFKDAGSENAMIGFAFFGLFALACLLFYLAIRRRRARNGQNPPDGR